MLAFAVAAFSACNQAPESSIAGILEIFDDFPTEFVESRTVRVWTPAVVD